MVKYDGRTDRWMNRWMDGWTDERMFGRTDGWTDGRQTDRHYFNCVFLQLKNCFTIKPNSISIYIYLQAFKNNYSNRGSDDLGYRLKPFRHKETQRYKYRQRYFHLSTLYFFTPIGSVTVDSLLDRETLDAYTLTIQASDDGTPSRSATTQVDISITDVNDNRPSFEKLSYSFRVTENNPSDHEVGKVGPATDEDKDENGEIVYSIISGDSSGMFYLGSSGELKALKSLDREMMPSYDLIIEARDKGSPSLYSQVPVKVIVDDKNDNAPEFSPKSYDCEISENSAEKTRVCFVHASDKDADQNGAVTYELVGLSSFFSVDQVSLYL